MKLAGRTAPVTGGSRGIGKAVVWALAREGAKVAFVYRSNKEAADKLVADLELDQRVALAFQADVKDKQAADTVVETVLEKWEKIDILVNNAGVIRDGLLATMSLEQWNGGHPDQFEQRVQFLPRGHAADDVRAVRTDCEHVERGGPFRQPGAIELRSQQGGRDWFYAVPGRGTRDAGTLPSTRSHPVLSRPI